MCQSPTVEPWCGLPEDKRYAWGRPGSDDRANLTSIELMAAAQPGPNSHLVTLHSQQAAIACSGEISNKPACSMTFSDHTHMPAAEIVSQIRGIDRLAC